MTNNKKKNSLKLLGHSPQTTTTAHDQKRTREICKAKNFTGSSKIQNLLSSPFINAQGTTEEILQQNSANPALLKAI
jgi:hypothetical protein